MPTVSPVISASKYFRKILISTINQTMTPQSNKAIGGKTECCKVGKHEIIAGFACDRCDKPIAQEESKEEGEFTCIDCGKSSLIHDGIYNCIKKESKQMNTREEWEKEFELGGKFVDFEGNYRPYWEDGKELKDFIKNLISQIKEEQKVKIEQGTSVEFAERITIDYANLSGREDVNRAEFRKRTLENLNRFQSSIEQETREKIAREVKRKNLVELKVQAIKMTMANP